MDRSKTSPSPAHGPTQEALAEYRAKGYVVVRGLFDAGSVAAIAADCERLGDDPALLHRDNLRAQLRRHETMGEIVDRLDPVIDLLPSCRAVADDGRLDWCIAELLGEPGLLFKDKLILKSPGTHGYGAHQDVTFYGEPGIPGQELIAACLALDEVDANNGGIRFFHGGPRKELVAPAAGDIFGASSGVIPTATLAAWHSETPTLHPGDVVFFDGLVPHDSDVNRSDRPRRQLYLSYAPARHVGLRERYYEMFRSTLRRERADRGSSLYFR